VSLLNAVLRAGIRKGLIFHASGLERGLVGRPRGVDALVDFGKVNEQRRLDGRDLVDGRSASVEGNGRGQVRQAGREEVGDTAAEAEAHDAQVAVAHGACLREGRCGDEIFTGLGLVQRREQFARFVFVAGIAA
jgi:hypothetical protein